MLKTRNVTEINNMSVYTDDGAFFGIVEESIITDNKVTGWRVRSTKGSVLNRILGGARGVIVPHQLVKSIDDIMIVSRSAIPSGEGGETETI